jgi:hypothetical protein
MRKPLALAAFAAALTLAAPADAAVKRLEATMSGAQEAPTGGDPDGRGSARLRVNPAAKRVCFKITMRNIDASVAAHIHAGRRGQAGSIVVPLFEGASTATVRSGCVENQPKAVLRDIARHPKRFYVNVHTAAYPGGAIRGQLHVPN